MWQIKHFPLKTQRIQLKLIKIDQLTLKLIKIDQLTLKLIKIDQLTLKLIKIDQLTLKNPELRTNPETHFVLHGFFLHVTKYSFPQVQKIVGGQVAFLKAKDIE